MGLHWKPKAKMLKTGNDMGKHVKGYNSICRLNVDDDGMDYIENAITVTDKKFRDVVYKYGKCSLPDVEAGIPMRFEYFILSNKNMFDTNSDEFRNFIGDILVEMIDEEYSVNENPA
jgi:hypothetical protein